MWRRTGRAVFTASGSPVTHMQVENLDGTGNGFGIMHLAYLTDPRAGIACPPSPCAGLSPARTTTRTP